MFVILSFKMDDCRISKSGHKTHKTYHEQASAPASSTTDIRPISREEFATKRKSEIC